MTDERRKLLKDEYVRERPATRGYVDDNAAAGVPGPTGPAGADGAAGADGSDGADFDTAPFIHLTKTSAAVDNIGGANGATKDITWDSQLATDAAFTHSTSTNNHQVTVNGDGRYSIKATVTGIQGGSSRTTFMLYPTVGGTADLLGVARNYSRGSNYGDTSNTINTEIELSDGDVLAIQNRIDDTDGAYVTNTQYDQCELIIRKIG